MLVDDFAARAKQHSVSSFPGAVGKIRIFDVSGIVNLVKSPQSEKSFPRISAGAAACVKHGDIISLFIYSIRWCVTHVNASKDQRPECLAGFFTNLGGVIIEDLRGNSEDVWVLESLQKWAKKTLVD